MESVCQKCGKLMTDENIDACRGTPAEVGCIWKAEAAGPNPDYVEGSGGYSPGDAAAAEKEINEFHPKKAPDLQLFTVEDLLARLQPHERRVIDECVELSNRRSKLSTFICSSQFLELEPVDRVLLTEQSSAMLEYELVLAKRIDRFKPASILQDGEKPAAASVPVEDIKPKLLNADDAWLNAHYKAMVDRFLAWRLPQDFAPDCYIGFEREKATAHGWPAGTNLLHAGQALEMFKHCVDLPPATCQGTNCGATNGTDHSPECIVEAAEAQGWADAPEAVEARAKIAAPKLTPADIEGVIVSEHYFLASQGMVGNFEEDVTDIQLDMLDNVTFCVLILRNGTKVTGVNHGPVSTANFDAQKGREYARKNAVEKIWELEGYLLRERLANPTHITLAHLSAEDDAALVEALRNAPPGTLEVADPSVLTLSVDFDGDAYKGAQLLAIVRAFVEKQRIPFPDPMHQTDKEVDEAYDLILDLVKVAGYLPEEDED